MSKTGNCPYCSSPNCTLGWKDFSNETKKEKKMRNFISTYLKRDNKGELQSETRELVANSKKDAIKAAKNIAELENMRFLDVLPKEINLTELTSPKF